MKLLFLLSAAFLQASANGYGQTISLSLKNASLEKVFTEIQKQTPFLFVYTNEQLQNTSTVSIDVKNEPLSRVMDICLKYQLLDYTLRAPYVIIKIKEITPGVEPALNDLRITINGRIINEKGEPVVGATIAVKGSKLATASNDNGEFSLEFAGNYNTLIVTSIGYAAQEVSINGRNQVIIILRAVINTLDETVIMAYGNTTKRLNTGNISKVSGEEISKQPVSNPLAALEGRVPGMVITQTSGIAGSAFKVEIRGRSALDFSYSRNDPLFIIDGVPFEPGNISTNQITNATSKTGNISEGGLSPLNTINPADIESIEVLKDADATAIYGSRGANGVILITTKKGQAGKTKITASITTGFSKHGRLMSMLNTQQYLQMRREAFANDGIVPTAANAPELLVWDTTRYTDFTRMLTGNTAKTTRAQVSVSGGNINTQFRFGMGYSTESNTLSGDLSDDIISAHLHAAHRSDNKKLSITVSGSFANDKNKLTRDNLVRYRNLPPNIQLYDSAGNLKWSEKGIDYITLFNNQVGNPLSLLQKRYTSVNENLIWNLNISYRILKELVFRMNSGYNSFRTDETAINPKSSFPPSFNTMPFSAFANNASTSWILEPQVDYSMMLGGGKLSVLAGATWQNSNSKGQYISANNYSSDLLLNSISAAGSVTVSNTYQQYRYNAFFGRLNYNWKEKYIVNLTGRRDGSSRFGPGKRIADFSALGIAWIFSNENFARKALGFLSFGKIRGSLGKTGNDQVGNYKYLDLWNSTSSPYQGISGLTPGSLFNPDYNWERTRKYEMALELGLFKDRVLFSSSFYLSRSGNQLVNYKLPAQVGFTSVIKNLPALVENKGIEIVLVTENIRSKNFSWKTVVNITIPENKLISFPGLATSTYSSTFMEGRSLSIFRGYRYLGVNDTTGLYMFEDLNKSGTITTADKQFLGNLDPHFYGGLQNNLSYKKITLGFFFEFRKQPGENYLGRLSAVESPGRLNNQPVIVLNRWRKPGDQNPIQRFSTNSSTSTSISNFISSDGIYSDASYIRLKNIYLNYSIPDIMAKKFHVQEGNVFFQGQNLFVVTGYKGSDPETQDFYTLPPQKTFIIGVKLIF
jgi:TonB-linked SusC/RagA family outer membrane protein